MKLVIVDGSGTDRGLCRVLVEKTYGSGLEFFEEETGEKGLEICRTTVPDCLLLGDQLPDMTGIEFLARLQAGDVSRHPDFAIVMLTSLDSGAVAIAALKAGAHDYLPKNRITADGLSLVVDKATEKVRLIRELKTERDSMARSAVEKDALLREVHHRVKNNLQVIASLLRLQAEASGQEFVALRESQHRVESMALIHEQLYETADLRQVDLAKHASLLAANLFESYGVDRARIALLVTVAPLPLDVDQAIPAGLIVNELISNALKHAFPGGRAGSVSVNGGRRGGRIFLEVRDDGVGIAEDVELRKTKSLGMEIVNILTRQLKGELEVDRSRGATVRVSFPEKHGQDQILQSAGSGR